MGILSDQSFSSLEGSVSDLTLKAIEEMGFKKMTEIQVKMFREGIQYSISANHRTLY